MCFSFVNFTYSSTELVRTFIHSMAYVGFELKRDGGALYA
jgi:hypothetical protein